MTKSMNSLTPRRKTPCLPFRKSRRLLSALRLNARQVFQRLADERLAQWAERYPSASLCLVFDPAKASLTNAVKEAATPLLSQPARPHPSSVALPPRPRQPSPAAALQLTLLQQQCMEMRIVIVLLLLEAKHITFTCS